MTTCIDCLAAGRENKRPSPFDGRCATDNKAYRAEQKAHKRAVRGKRIYGIDREQQERLLAYQHDVCYICQVATGASKALAVDHDHATGEARGRLCSSCNQMIGRLRDDPEAFFRAAIYLCHPPSRDALARTQLPDGSWDWAHPIPKRRRRR